MTTTNLGEKCVKISIPIAIGTKFEKNSNNKIQDVLNFLYFKN